MSIHAVAEDRRATADVQVIADLAAGALESIARIHAAGLAEVLDIAENPVVVRYEPPVEVASPVEDLTEDSAEDLVEAEDEAVVEGPTRIEAVVEGPAEATTEVEDTAVVDTAVVDTAVEPVTAEFAAQVDVVQPVESLRAVPVSTRGRHFSEAETTEFAAQRAA